MKALAYCLGPGRITSQLLAFLSYALIAPTSGVAVGPDTNTAPSIDAVMAEELSQPCILSQSPTAISNQTVAAIVMNLSEPVVGADARAVTNYVLRNAGGDRLFGTMDDSTVDFSSIYADGSNQIQLVVLQTNQFDLRTWVERDYGNGSAGVWTVASNGTDVFQTINSLPTFFASDVDFADRQFIGRMRVEETGGDNDFIGLVFAFQHSPTTGRPNRFYYLSWKQGNQTDGEAGFKLLRVSNTGNSTEATMNTLLWNGENGPNIQVLARLTGANSLGWVDFLEYDFSVFYRTNGQIMVSIRETATGILRFQTALTDPTPLGPGRIGFLNHSQSYVRYRGLATSDALSEGLYQLTVKSGNPGLRGLDGALLDGNCDGTGGDDFRYNFVIDLTPPQVANVSLFSDRIEVAYFDLGGMNPATVLNSAHYGLRASGGDGTFNDGNEVTFNSEIGSITLDTNTSQAALTLLHPLPPEVYQFTIAGVSGVSDLAGNFLLQGTNYVELLDVTNYPCDCQEVMALGNTTNGFYTIDPDGPGGEYPITVECLMDLSAGGWTKLTTPVADSALNTDSTRAREFLYVKGDQWYRSPVNNLVWDWFGGQHLYGAYYYSVAAGESSIQITPSGELGTYGVGGSSGPFATAKVLLIYPGGRDPANALAQVCQDVPGIFGPGACHAGVTIYIRERATNEVWQLEVIAVPELGGYVTGAGTYAHGSVATITATPSPGFRFAGWFGDPVAEPDVPVTTVTMTTNRVVGARFSTADLIATDVSTTANALAGQVVQVTWRITNQGAETATGSWSDLISLSLDDQPGADIPLDSFPISTTIPSGATITRIQSIVLPANRTGTYWLVAEVNQNQGINETSFSNNLAVAANPITIVAPSRPNLKILTVAAPTNVFAGEQIVVEWLATNAGPGSTGSAQWEDAVYLSSNDEYDAADIPLCTTNNFTALGAGEAYRNQCVFRVPPRLEGPYYFIVRADSSHQVDEGDFERDNAQSSRLAQIAIGPYPDLQVALVNGPREAFSGQPAVVSWVITNAGSATTEEHHWDDRLFISADSDLRFLGSWPHDGRLQTNQSYTVTQQVVLPVGVSGSNFYFIVETDYRNQVWEYRFENNNTGVSSPASQINLTPPPDLTVGEVVVPAMAHAGFDISITYVVRNSGLTGTPNYSWRDAFYLSADAVWDAQDTPLGSEVHAGFLPRDGGYTNTVNMRLPTDMLGDHYLIVVADSQETVFELNRENNHAPSASPTRIHGLADLQPVSVTGPATALAGFSVNISFAITNAGPCPTLGSSWNDSVYLSTDLSLDTGTDTFLGRKPRGEPLDQGSYYETNVDLIIPIGLTGMHHLFVVTDSHGHVPEQDEANNILLAANPVMLNLPANDLEPVEIHVPSNAVAGFVMHVSVLVTNHGQHPIPNGRWRDLFYLSPDPILDGEDIEFGPPRNAGGLAANASYPQETDARIPDGLEGDYYVIVVVDSQTEVFEQDEGNNVAAGGPVRIVSIPPDLIVESCRAPGSGQAGRSIVVEWTVRNLGPGQTTRNAWWDRVSLVADDISVPATVLGSFRRNSPLNAMEGYNRQERIAIPPSQPAGVYHLRIATDASDEVYETDDANNACQSGAIAISRPNIDLIVTAVEAPVEAQSGHSLVVSWTVHNTGDTAVSGLGWADELYLSTTPAWSPDAELLGRFPQAGGLGAGANRRVTSSFTLPWDLSGDRYVVVRSDYANNVVETIEANNDAATPAPTYIHLAPTADLAVTDVNAPTTALSGQAVELSWRVINYGAATLQRWFDAVYLSQDQIFDPATDMLLGSFEQTGGIAEESNRSVSRLVELRPGLEGTFYLFIVTDSNNRIYERAAEDNNIASSGIPITIETPALADLVVFAVNAHDARVGELVTVSYGVANQGTNALIGQWEDTLYLSFDRRWDINDTILARVSVTETLAAGEFYLRMVTVPVPGVVEGSYYVIARTDVLNEFPESDESNNVGSSEERAMIDMLELALGQSYSTQLFANASHYYKTPTAGGEVLSIKLESSATNGYHELYTRFREIPTRALHDRRHTSPFSPDQEIIVPEARRGPYFTLVYGQSVPNPPAPYTITARSLPFSLDTVTPGRIGDNGQVTLTLRGALFKSNATVRLVRGNATVSAASVVVPDPTTAKARFSFTNQTHGSYTVVLRNPNGQEASLPDAVTIEAATVPQIDLFVSGNLRPLVGTRLSVSGLLRNVGNVDIAMTRLVASFDGDVMVGWRRPAGALPDSTDLTTAGMEPAWEQNSPTAVFDGRNTLDTFYLRDLEPGAEVPFDFFVRGFLPGPFQVVFLAEALPLEAIESSTRDDVEPSECGEFFTWLRRVSGSEVRVDGCGEGVAPRDPNEKNGPAGAGPNQFISYQEPAAYTIHFENLATANAAARNITVIDPIAESFDIRTVRLQEIVFASERIVVSGDQSFYQTQMQLGPAFSNLLVDIVATVDVAQHHVRWSLTALDPATGQPPEAADLGLLFPEDGSGRGQGYLSYTIAPMVGTPTGTRLTNSASIVFDNNEPIETNPVWNTVDGLAPISQVAELPPAIGSSLFPISWFGRDDTGGSGVRRFDVYVSDNNGPYQFWLTADAAGVALYPGVPGHFYQAYSIAIDASGNVEPVPPVADAQTLVVANSPPTLDPMASYTNHVGITLGVQAVAHDPDQPYQTLQFELLSAAPASARFYSTNGLFVWRPSASYAGSTNAVTIAVRDNGSPSLSATQTFSIVVPDFIEAELAPLIVPAGLSGCFPLRLASSAGLTNLLFELTYAPGRLLDVSIDTGPDAGTASRVLMTSSNALFRIEPKPGQVLQGTQEVATLCFTLEAGQSSTFLPVPILRLAGYRSDGSVVNDVTDPLRLTIIGEAPLVEAAIAPNGQLVVILYGQTNIVYAVESTVGWDPPVQWQTIGTALLTNHSQRLDGITLTNQAMFIRARRLGPPE